MSHSNTQLGGNTAIFPARLTIIDYALGGETVLPSEIHPNATGVDAVWFATIPASQNSLGVPLFPLLNAGKVMLFRFTSGSPVEIAATTGLNATVSALVHISAW